LRRLVGRHEVHLGTIVLCRGVEDVSLRIFARSEALVVLAVDLAVTVVIDAIATDFPDTTPWNCGVTALAARLVAQVGRAWISVVTRGYRTRRRNAHASLARLAGRAGVAVVARQRVRHEHATRRRITRIGRAGVLVVAHHGSMCAGRSVAAVDRARVAVVACLTRTFADPRRADIIDRPGVAVVAHRPGQGGVRAAHFRIADICRAGIAVVAVFRGAAYAASARIANVASRARISIVARHARERRVHAALHHVAGVERTGIAVVAYDRHTGGTCARLAHVADRAFAAVVAERAVVHGHAAGLRVARFGRARIAVVAVDDHVRAGHAVGQVSAIDGAGVLVITGGRTSSANAFLAHVAHGIRVAVVAGRPGQGSVLTTVRRIAGVGGAGVAVVAHGCGSAHADTALAHVADGAGIAVAALRPIGLNLVHAARRRVTRVHGAVVLVVAVDGVMLAPHCLVTAIGRTLVLVVAVERFAARATSRFAHVAGRAGVAVVADAVVGNVRTRPSLGIAGVGGAGVVVVAASAVNAADAFAGLAGFKRRTRVAVVALGCVRDVGVRTRSRFRAPRIDGAGVLVVARLGRVAAIRRTITVDVAARGAVASIPARCVGTLSVRRLARPATSAPSRSQARDHRETGDQFAQFAHGSS